MAKSKRDPDDDNDTEDTESEAERKKERKRLGADVKASAAGLVELHNPETGQTVTIHRGDMSHKEFLDVVNEASGGTLKLKNDLGDLEVDYGDAGGEAPSRSKQLSRDEEVARRGEAAVKRDEESIVRAKAKEANLPLVDRIERGIGAVTDAIDKRLVNRGGLQEFKEPTPQPGNDIQPPEAEPIKLQPFKEGGGGRGGLQGITDLVKGATPMNASVALPENASPGLTWDANANGAGLSALSKDPAQEAKNRELVAKDPTLAINLDGSIRPATQEERDMRNQEENYNPVAGRTYVQNGMAATPTPGGGYSIGAAPRTPKDAPVDPNLNADIPAEYKPKAPLPAGPDPLLAGESATGAAGISMPGMGGMPRLTKTDPQLYKDFANATDQAAKAQLDASKTIGQVQEQQAKNLTAAQMEVDQQQKDAYREAQLASEARMRGIERAAKAQAATENTLAEVRAAASKGIDPARYWNNQSLGQKAMAVISSALFGFAGKGMEALQRLDALVEQDNRLQESDRASKVAGLTEVAHGYERARQFALEQGASEAEAHHILSAAKREAIKTSLDMLAASSNNAQVQMQAANLSAGLQQGIAQGKHNVLQINQQGTHQQNMEAIDMARLQKEMEHMQLQAKIAAMKANEKPSLEPADFKAVQDSRDAITTLDEMAKYLKENKGTFDRMVKSGFGKLSEKERAAVDAYTLKAKEFQRAITGGVLRPGEDKIFSQIIPEKNQWADPMPAIQNFRRDELLKYRKKLEGLHMNKRDVSTFVPELKKWESQDEAPPDFMTPH